MDYIVCVQKSIDYIEDNLKSEVSLSECARVAGFSIYHYYRVFGAFVGMPVMEYVRKRKLAWALTDLQKKRRIIDIAMDYGFGSERAFSRAFKKEYGRSPGKYRDQTDYRTIPAKLTLKSFKENHLNGGVIMEPKIIKKPAFKVTGFERKTTNIGGVNYRELPQFWDRYFAENWAKILRGRIKPVQDTDLGLCFPGGMEKGEFSYVIGVEVADFNDIPEEMFRGEVPAATYAVFTTPPAERLGGGFSKVIQRTWDYVFAEWFPNSGYEFDDKSKIDFELYDERAQGDHGIQIDIYVPVVKKR
ncbi:MAG TPA: AraC family transcriptional regulator [Dehalococcoidales bacterium]